jgi:hypothetical protein
MDGQGRQQFLDELLPLHSSFCRIRTGGTMRQFYQSDNRESDIGISSCAGDDREHLPRILPLSLGSDQHTRIED